MTSQEILKAVEAVFEVPLGVLKSRSREQHVVDARYVVYHFMLRELRFSSRRVGRMLNRDRSNYNHALNRYDTLYSTDRAFRRRADQVAARVGLEASL